MRLISPLLVFLALACFAQAANVQVNPNPDWAGDATVKVACKQGAGPLTVLPSLPTTLTIPNIGNGQTLVVTCYAFRGTDPNAPLIRSLEVSSTQTFPLAPPSLLLLGP